MQLHGFATVAQGLLPLAVCQSFRLPIIFGLARSLMNSQSLCSWNNCWFHIIIHVVMSSSFTHMMVICQILPICNGEWLETSLCTIWMQTGSFRCWRDNSYHSQWSNCLTFWPWCTLGQRNCQSLGLNQHFGSIVMSYTRHCCGWRRTTRCIKTSSFCRNN